MQVARLVPVAHTRVFDSTCDKAPSGAGVGTVPLQLPSVPRPGCPLPGLCAPGVAQGSAAPVPSSARWVPPARAGASWLPPAPARALLCGLLVSVLLSAATRKQGDCCFSNKLFRPCALDLFSCGHPRFYFRWCQTLSADDITSLLAHTALLLWITASPVSPHDLHIITLYITASLITRDSYPLPSTVTALRCVPKCIYDILNIAMGLLRDSNLFLG